MECNARLNDSSLFIHISFLLNVCVQWNLIAGSRAFSTITSEIILSRKLKLNVRAECKFESSFWHESALLGNAWIYMAECFWLNSRLWYYWSITFETAKTIIYGNTLLGSNDFLTDEMTINAALSKTQLEVFHAQLSCKPISLLVWTFLLAGAELNTNIRSR